MEIVIGLLIILVLFGLIHIVHILEKSGTSNWEPTVQKKLSSLNTRYNDSDIHTMKSLVMEADALLDFCFKKKHLQGTTMGGRLKKAETLYKKSFYHEIWTAHKVRNVLAHEIDAEVSISKLVSSYITLTKAIKHLL